MPDATVNLDAATLDGNLAALVRTDPAVGAVLAAARPRMPAVTPCTTRDGQFNLRLQSADGRLPWFGRTSIPLTRAKALLDQFQPGNANVLLPGIAEGTEVALLLGRLASHRAVFVWESEPVNLLLALQLHDFARAIEEDRLVLVIAEESRLMEVLLEALERRCGHFCPDRILMWPWQSMAEMAVCRSAVETAYHEIERRRRDRLAEVQQQLVSLPAGPPPAEAMTAALLSIHTTEDTLTWAGAIGKAAREGGWSLASAVIRNPADVHALSRASRLAAALRTLPHAAILLDVCRAEVADILPPGVPAITWLTHQTPVDQSVANRVGPADRIFATDSRLAEALQGAGLDPDRITVVPLPCLLTNDEPPPDWGDRPFDIVIMANLAPTDPAAHGHDLQTHTRIWQAVVERIRERVDRFVDAEVPSVLAAVESRLRMKIDHPDARRQFVRVLGGPVASHMIWHDLTQRLENKELATACWGVGWSAAPCLRPMGPLPGLAARAAIYRQAKCVLFASPTGLVPADVLLAADAGAIIAWRKHPLDARPGGLATLLEPGREAIVLATNHEVAPALQRVISAAQAWRKIVSAARQRCRTEHTPVGALARLQAAATSFSSKRAN